MEQTRLVSLIEAVINTVIGFGLSFLIYPFAAWVSGMPYSGSSHFIFVAIFTVVSVARGYVIRRFFNNGLHLVAIKLAKQLTNFRRKL